MDTETLEALMRFLGIDEAEIGKRKAFLGFTEEDRERLRDLHRRIDDLGLALVDAFYSHLQAFPETAALLPDEATVERLKRSQSRYFHTLTAGDYGMDYVRDRLKVGLTHHRIGLRPQWYLGAYGHYLTWLMPRVWMRYQDPGDFLKAWSALVKIVFFDIGLAMDAYHQSDRRTAEKTIERHSLLLASLGEGVLGTDREGRVTFLNPAGERLLGWKAEEIRGRPLHEVLPIHTQEGQEGCCPALEALKHDGLHEAKALIAGKEGRVFPVHCLCTPIREGDEVVGVVMAFRDITKEQAQERRILELNRFYRLLSHVNEIIIRAPPQEELFEEVCRLLVEEGGYRMAWIGLVEEGWVVPKAWAGHEAGYFKEKPIAALDIPEGRGPTGTAMRTGRPFICRDIASDPAMAPWREAALSRGYRSSAALPFKEGGKVVGTINIYAGAPHAFDEEEEGLLKEMAADLGLALEMLAKRKDIEYLATHDPLTGLPNRHLFEDRLTQAIALTHWHGRMMAVLFLDLDRFKEINDVLGHALGDEVLREIAQRLGEAVRDGDTVARLGGDEFGFILADVAQDKDVVPVAERILKIVETPLHVKGKDIFLSASLGISCYPQDGKDAKELLKHADTALFEAKARGRNTYAFFQKAMAERMKKRRDLSDELRLALERGEFLLHYQPQIALATGRMVGVEALLRWQRGERLVPPLDFIPVLEETGLIVPVGAWVLKTAFAQQCAWENEGLSLRMAVNISARQFKDKGLLPLIGDLIKLKGDKPCNMEVEITESLLFEDARDPVEMLKALEARGVTVAIDDFGTGFSSLARLKQLPIHTLKVDRTFVKDIPQVRESVAICSAIFALAQGLGIKVVAEGVETKEQAAWLEAMGCAEAQGYLFCRPVPPEAIPAFARKGGGLSGEGV